MITFESEQIFSAIEANTPRKHHTWKTWDWLPVSFMKFLLWGSQLKFKVVK